MQWCACHQATDVPIYRLCSAECAAKRQQPMGTASAHWPQWTPPPPFLFFSCLCKLTLGKYLVRRLLGATTTTTTTMMQKRWEGKISVQEQAAGPPSVRARARACVQVNKIFPPGGRSPRFLSLGSGHQLWSGHIFLLFSRQVALAPCVSLRVWLTAERARIWAGHPDNACFCAGGSAESTATADWGWGTGGFRFRLPGADDNDGRAGHPSTCCELRN